MLPRAILNPDIYQWTRFFYPLSVATRYEVLVNGEPLTIAGQVTKKTTDTARR